MKAEGDAIEKEIRTGVKRGPNFNHWDEIPALRKVCVCLRHTSA